MKEKKLALLLVALVLAAARPALAYLDPGSGSMLLQLVLGGVAGLIVIVKLYWKRMLSALGLGGRTPPATQGDPGGPTAS